MWGSILFFGTFRQLRQNLHESFGHNALKIKAGLDKGREHLSTFSCSSATAYKKHLSEDHIIRRRILTKGILRFMLGRREGLLMFDIV